MLDFNEIYKVYFKDVYCYVYSICKNKIIAEDITQETFFKVLKNINKYDGTTKIYVWLCQIAKNTYYTYYKRSKRFSSLVEFDDMSSDGNLEEKLINNESVYEVHKILHFLAEPYKEVFNLRMFGELSFKQIGLLFDKSESWARVIFYRAKNKIKEELK